MLSVSRQGGGGQGQAQYGKGNLRSDSALILSTTKSLLKSTSAHQCLHMSPFFRVIKGKLTYASRSDPQGVKAETVLVGAENGDNLTPGSTGFCNQSHNYMKLYC